MGEKIKNRIRIIKGVEFDLLTGKQVFRDRNDRPYVLDDCDHNPIDAYERGLIYLALLRRTVQDASGPDLLDNSVTPEIQDESREYLLLGKLERFGQYVFEGVEVKTQKRIYESRFMKFRESNDLKESTVTLKEICEYSGIDYLVYIERINEWAKNRWDRNHVFYKNVIEATKGIA